MSSIVFAASAVEIHRGSPFSSICRKRAVIASRRTRGRIAARFEIWPRFGTSTSCRAAPSRGSRAKARRGARDGAVARERRLSTMRAVGEYALRKKTLRGTPTVPRRGGRRCRSSDSIFPTSSRLVEQRQFAERGDGSALLRAAYTFALMHILCTGPQAAELIRKDPKG